MEDEGKLIDGYLQFLDENRFQGTLSFIRQRVSKDKPENTTADFRNAKMIESRLNQYNLATIHKNQTGHDISGLGRDVLKIGYSKWVENLEHEKEQAKILRIREVEATTSAAISADKSASSANKATISSYISTGIATLSFLFGFYQYIENRANQKAIILLESKFEQLKSQLLYQRQNTTKKKT